MSSKFEKFYKKKKAEEANEAKKAAKKALAKKKMKLSYNPLKGGPLKKKGPLDEE
tara:strand:- start:685 stop:849 length:165 start_codon:yes stop_codon:yes gene_type:complete